MNGMGIDDKDERDVWALRAICLESVELGTTL